MKIAATYSFNHGTKAVVKSYPDLLKEIERVISSIDEEEHRTKKSKEVTRTGKVLYSPTSLNKAFKKSFAEAKDWNPIRVKAEYSVKHYRDGYKPKAMNKGAFREMDFVKRKLGVEVQFGKYSFMVYNVCAKMTIFKKLGHIDMGIEIVPMKEFVRHMSSGVSYFEQFVWDLETRGVSDLDIPVHIIGIAADWERVTKQTLPAQIVSVSDELLAK